MLHRRFTFFILLLCSLPFYAQQSGRLALRDNWHIQNGCQVKEKGELISTAGFHPNGWYATSVPTTVVAALVANKVYPDPYYGMNLRSLPGMEYPIGEIFTNQPMPDGSSFKCMWWYRTEFQVPAADHGKKIWIHFDGINYRASLWLNGKLVAGPDKVAGAWRTYEFEISDLLRFGKPNVLAVEVAAQTETDLGINWVDWNPSPPDKNMGLWRDVYLTKSGAVSLRDTQVLTKLDTASFASADLVIHAELSNISGQPVEGTLTGTIAAEGSSVPPAKDRIQFSKQIQLAAGEIKNVSLNSEEFKQLHLQNPRVWWPAKLGKQDLYRLNLEFKIGPQTSDSSSTTFGVREVTSELTEKSYRLFKINGKNILIRGAGWAPDMLYRTSPVRQEQELRYVLDMGLNTVRLEGKIETDHFFDLADRMGVLIMAGWCCCSHWEHWDKWTANDKTIAMESQRSQLTRIRNHPSVFVWLNGSDNPPPAEIEQAYLDVANELHWPNPILSSATARQAASGATGVKMSGPYEYVPPSYWYTDVHLKYGGAYGYNTETSPGPAPPLIESIQRMMPKEHWWPIDDVWGYHSGSGSFKTMDIFNTAMGARYGKPNSLAEFEKRAQVMTYDNERAMFESYTRNKYTSTGVIQWMLNNAWPGMIWHLYDYYLVPGGGYFGTKKACEPVHALYGYDDNSIWVVNSLYQPFPGMRLKTTVYNLDMSEQFSKETPLDVPPDSSTRVLTLPSLSNLSTTYFVRLELVDATNKAVSKNFYWLSTVQESHDWAKTNYFVTPVIQHADLTALNTLAPVRLGGSLTTTKQGSDELLHVTLTNPSKTLAFAVQLKVKDHTGGLIAPVLIEDNYFPLLPGEKRTVTIRYTLDERHGPIKVHVNGYNVEDFVVSSAVGLPVKDRSSKSAD